MVSLLVRCNSSFESGLMTDWDSITISLCNSISLAFTSWVRGRENARRHNKHRKNVIKNLGDILADLQTRVVLFTAQRELVSAQIDASFIVRWCVCEENILLKCCLRCFQFYPLTYTYKKSVWIGLNEAIYIDTTWMLFKIFFKVSFSQPIFQQERLMSSNGLFTSYW